MSQYSEMMGSFIRTGNYPMEANYIFPNEAALKEFYSDPINSTILHKGLLRVVENGGNGKQALYWVVKKQTNDELEFVKLIENIDIDEIDTQLKELSDRLNEEIKNRQDSDTAIWGTNDPTNVPEELNSLLDISVAITDLIKRVNEIHSELIDSDTSIKSQVKALAGTQEDDVIEYLKTLPYSSLTEASNALNKFLNELDNTSNQINTLPELKSFLEGYTDAQKLKNVLLELYSDILGDPVPSSEFRTLRAIEDFVRILKSDSENSDENIQSELDRTQIGVGLSGDGSYNADKETYYLKDATSIMNALKILDSLMFEAISGITIQPSNTDVVDLSVRKELEGYVIGAKLNLSTAMGNELIKKEDGLYFGIKSTYSNGVLSIYANDKLISQHILGLSSLVDSAIYDPSQEAIIIVFKLLNGDKQQIIIPVGGLIRELEVNNEIPEKVVELQRETVVDGPDQLSADVRIYSDKHNILKKVGNTLSVDGTSNSITHNDQTLSEVLEKIKSDQSSNNTTLNNKIDSEIDRAKQEEQLIKESIQEVEEKVNSDINDLQLKDTELSGAILQETNRAVESENNIKSQVQDLKLQDSEIKQSIADLQTTVTGNSKEISNVRSELQLEQERATNAEENLSRRASAIESELSSVSQKQDELNQGLLELDTKVDLQKQEVLQEIHLISDQVDGKIASKADKSEVETIRTKVNDTSEKLNEEILRATQKDSELLTEINKKIESVEVQKVSDSRYSIIVDGSIIGQIDIPQNQFLESVEIVDGSILRFTFNTGTGTNVVDVDLQEVIGQALEELEQEINKKANIDSPIFTGIPQVAISPDSADASQRIPSTNWVRERIQEAISSVSTDNFYTKQEVRDLIKDKADLVNGIVPLEQLPRTYWIDVE